MGRRVSLTRFQPVSRRPGDLLRGPFPNRPRAERMTLEEVARSLHEVNQKTHWRKGKFPIYFLYMSLFCKPSTVNVLSTFFPAPRNSQNPRARAFLSAWRNDFKRLDAIIARVARKGTDPASRRQRILDLLTQVQAAEADARASVRTIQRMTENLDSLMYHGMKAGVIRHTFNPAHDLLQFELLLARRRVEQALARESV